MLLNSAAIEELYQRYLTDPTSVDPSWVHFFQGMEFSGAVSSSPDLRIFQLIDAYRTFGHLFAKFNPIATEELRLPRELDLKELGFKPEEENNLFPTCGFLKEAKAPLKKMVEALQATYCRTIGIEYMKLGNVTIESWLQKKIEPYFDLHMTPEEKKGIMHDLNRAELFEQFIHTKYVGQKRFSLEGAETMIPVLEALLDRGAEEGVEEVVLGMAHRGRLNVLVNLLGKSYAAVFNEFEDHYEPDLDEGTGDVKYHRGYVGGYVTKKGKEVHVTLNPNPSHLEAVDPVVEGTVRARQELLKGKEGVKKVLPVLIHGDAAVSGQGVVYETMQLCRLNGYKAGGTVHIVINNQIGFTTPAKDERSTRYCTDIGLAFGAPVFHVNAEDPEGCVVAAQLACHLRQEFQCDVFIDINCYRKYGHNEGDEPHFTQPLEYQLIKSKKAIRELYLEKLIQEGVLDSQAAAQMEADFKQSLRSALESISHSEKKESSPKNDVSKPVKTSVENSRLVALLEKASAVPAGFNIHPKLARLLQERVSAIRTDPKEPVIDWAVGEQLAYATLVTEGVHVRLSGQDCRRGTFSHRHAVWVDQKNETSYFPLSHLSSGQAPLDVYNSPLSEYAVLGFEFGYSMAYPNMLPLWEAQYGDFANGAQIIIDQFLSTSEQKWQSTTNLTLLLPHGYEGSGPEHSSARMERFLQLAGDENMRVVNCSTPAQFFHVLRRQALCAVKKPLIVFTPKALLRHPLCTSCLNDFSSGAFQEILDDPNPPQKAKRLIFCSGKVYYDLAAERTKRKAEGVVLLRIEQLYPFESEKVRQLLSKYSGFSDCLWVQEEHSNMGAFEFIRPLLNQELGKEVRYAGRRRSASPAAGSYALHKKQLATFIEEAFIGVS